MLGSIKEEWGAEIIEGKKREKIGMRVESGIKNKMKGESKKTRVAEHKQRLQFQKKGLCSSVSVVLMAGKSMVDEAYYVAKIIFNNGSITDNKINKHGEEIATMKRFRF